MVYNPNTHQIFQLSTHPRGNFKGEGFIAIDDFSQLAVKIVENYPNINVIVEDGKIVDVEVTE